MVGRLMKTRTEGEPELPVRLPGVLLPTGVGQRSMGNHNYAIGRREAAEGFVVARKRVKARGAKGPYG